MKLGLAAQGQGEEGSGSPTEAWFRNEAATWKGGDPQEKEASLGTWQGLETPQDV